MLFVIVGPGGNGRPNVRMETVSHTALGAWAMAVSPYASQYMRRMSGAYRPCRDKDPHAIKSGKVKNLLAKGYRVHVLLHTVGEEL